MQYKPDNDISWLTGNPLEASFDRPLMLHFTPGLSNEVSPVLPVNHSLPSSNYNVNMFTAVTK